MHVNANRIRPIMLKDFEEASQTVGVVEECEWKCAPSVNPASLQQFIDWNKWDLELRDHLVESLVRRVRRMRTAVSVLERFKIVAR